MSKPNSSNRVEVPSDILFELLTPSEVRMVKNRWKIISLLQENYSVRRIAEMAGVGTDTVVRMSRKRFESTKIKTFLGVEKSTLKQISSSKWVFGGDKDK